MPFTLVHADYHPGNLLWHDNKAKIIDWELAMVGPGIMDLGYFLFMQGSDVLLENWERLVELYVSELAKFDVIYDVDAAKKDFVDVTLHRMAWWFCVVHHPAVYASTTSEVK